MQVLLGDGAGLASLLRYISLPEQLGGQAAEALHNFLLSIKDPVWADAACVRRSDAAGDAVLACGGADLVVRAVRAPGAKLPVRYAAAMLLQQLAQRPAAALALDAAGADYALSQLEAASLAARDGAVVQVAVCKSAMLAVLHKESLRAAMTANLAPGDQAQLATWLAALNPLQESIRPMEQMASSMREQLERRTAGSGQPGRR